MANLLKNVLGGAKSAPSPISGQDDADFADFAGAPDPSPASISAATGASVFPPLASSTSSVQVPYTKWYRVWERTSVHDFYQEMIIAPFILGLVLIHLWGTGVNRRRARGWIKAHAPILRTEFALVGFDGKISPTFKSEQEIQHAGELLDLEGLLKEKTPNEFTTYATGRQNVAFVDFKLSFVKRYNPLARFGEAGLGFFFDSFPAPEERLETTAYPFDGKETQLVPVIDSQEGEKRKATGNSTYDGFVWGIVHKDIMQRLRDDRYDLSLTATKDHPKLPAWVTVMTESAEITDIMLTQELIKAIELAGDGFEALVVTDMPMDQPKKLDDLAPKKRINLSLRLPSSSDAYTSTLPIFQYFLRLTDFMVTSGRFRPEALRRVRQTREEEIKKLKKLDDTEKAEERKLKGDKEKKEKRDALLKSMSADEQRKYLEKEREKDMRRSQKKKSVRA